MKTILDNILAWFMDLMDSPPTPEDCTRLIWVDLTETTEPEVMRIQGMDEQSLFFTDYVTLIKVTGKEEYWESTQVDQIYVFDTTAVTVFRCKDSVNDGEKD